MPGFPGTVLIPLGRLQTLTKPFLTRGALLFHHWHPRADDNLGSRHQVSESIAAVAIGRQTRGYEKRGKTNASGKHEKCRGAWGKFALRRVLKRGEFMGSVRPFHSTRW